MLPSLRIVLALLALAGFGLARPNPAAAASPRISILTYHRFDSVAPNPETIRTATFAEQLEWLRTHGVRVLALHDLVGNLANTASLGLSPAVVLTADDGHRSIYTEMYPLILRYGFHVTLFIYPSAISNATYALSWSQLKEMADSGLVDVQSHTYWHPNFAVEKRRLDATAYVDLVHSQLAKSKSVLESRIGTKVDLLAWPFGIHDAELEKQAVVEGYVAAFGMERRPLSPQSDRYALPRYMITDVDRGSHFAAIALGAQSGTGEE